MVEAEQLTFRYPNKASNVLTDIALRLTEGRTLIAGASGSGKSTLFSLMNRLYPDNCDGIVTGRLHLFDRSYETYAAGEVNRRVGTVFQDPDSQFVMQTVEEELIFTLENVAVARNEMMGRVATILEELQLTDYRHRTIHDLSGGEKQQIAVACALIGRPEWLLLDEPLAHLDPETAKRFVQWLDDVAWSVNVVVIEHRPFIWDDFFDREVELVNGRISYDGPFIARPDYTFSPVKVTKGNDMLFHVPQFNTKKFQLAASKLKVAEGEVIAVLGRNGSGKSTWLKSLAREHREVGLVPQSPAHLFVTSDVTRELAYGHNLPIEDILTRLGLGPVRNDHPLSLSHGQKRRLAIGVMMLSNKRLIAFDEPTAGQDEVSLRALYELIAERVRAGQTVLFVTHDLSFARIASTYYLMCDGDLSGPYDASLWDEPELLRSHGLLMEESR
ncbi:ABC transporter ATP-binding protein [Exiguobacterium aurantiacum]|uniref:Energy-coupling factor ABC transporter ATP-binding protein n=1 Tax=Exiguobacterium aurantiacum TaxID=33987 RepID=A0ABY5FSE5_9BACL|nr:ABC transporter ATP-binding protein [Exiguobacterium aurantiacum]UTT44329.1 energy-coupling factor ABC transporter ATP-binding protein [Exiguobacterium aurantiacum]